MTLNNFCMTLIRVILVKNMNFCMTLIRFLDVWTFCGRFFGSIKMNICHTKIEKRHKIVEKTSIFGHFWVFLSHFWPF